MKRLLCYLLSCLLILVPSTSLAEPFDDEWWETHEATVTLNGVEYYSDDEIRVRYGDILKVNIPSLEGLLFVSAYTRYDHGVWHEGDSTVAVATSDFDDLYIEVPYGEYGTELALRIQPTWEESNGEKACFVAFYFLEYIGGTQYIDVIPQLWHDGEYLDLYSTNLLYAKKGDIIKLSAYCPNDLAILNSTNDTWMKENHFASNTDGMAVLSYYWDNKPTIYAEDPTLITFSVPEEFEIGSTHILRFRAISTLDGETMEDGSHIKSNTGWCKVKVIITE